MSPALLPDTGNLQCSDEEIGRRVGFANQFYSSGGAGISDQPVSDRRVSEIEVNNTRSVSEIEEENESEINGRGEPMASIREEFEGSTNLFSLDIQSGDDNVFVAVGRAESSMDALVWALKHAVNPSTLVCLVHVFPQLQYIPTPLGKLSRDRVSPVQVESYMAQERSQRKELLQKFIHACSDAKVKVDTILIESDMVAKAILELIPVLNIRKLVIGTSKANLRKLRSRKGSEIAEQILQKAAPECCDVKVICETKEVKFDQIIATPSPRSNDDYSKPTQEEQQRHKAHTSISCGCFTFS